MDIDCKRELYITYLQYIRIYSMQFPIKGYHMIHVQFTVKFIPVIHESELINKINTIVK